MINHIVCWNFIESLSIEEKKEAGIKIKEGLEALITKIPGLLEIKVVINQNSSSNRDLCLFSKFESEAFLNGYQVHPEHILVATYVRSVTCERVCFDYEE